MENSQKETNLILRYFRPDTKYTKVNPFTDKRCTAVWNNEEYKIVDRKGKKTDLRPGYLTSCSPTPLILYLENL